MQEFFVLLESEFINLTNGFKGEVPDDLLALERNEQLSLNCDRFSEILNKILENNRSSEIENGMNTFGILLDRITILKCKSKFSQDETSRFVAEGQLARIIISLENCGRGDAELLKKEQVEQHLGGFSSHGQALITLLRSNIAMWLNQDLLYTKDVDSIEVARLRNYILFFGRENSLRNRSIAFLDGWFNKDR